MCSTENIRQAIKNAAKGKTKYRKVRKVLRNLDKYADELHKLVTEDKFVPSPTLASS